MLEYESELTWDQLSLVRRAFAACSEEEFESFSQVALCILERSIENADAVLNEKDFTDQGKAFRDFVSLSGMKVREILEAISDDELVFWLSHVYPKPDQHGTILDIDQYEDATHPEYYFYGKKILSVMENVFREEDDFLQHDIQVLTQTIHMVKNIIIKNKGIGREKDIKSYDDFANVLCCRHCAVFGKHCYKDKNYMGLMLAFMKVIQFDTQYLFSKVQRTKGFLSFAKSIGARDSVIKSRWEKNERLIPQACKIARDHWENGSNNTHAEMVREIKTIGKFKNVPKNRLLKEIGNIAVEYNKKKGVPGFKK